MFLGTYKNNVRNLESEVIVMTEMNMIQSLNSALDSLLEKDEPKACAFVDSISLLDSVRYYGESAVENAVRSYFL